MKISGTSRGVFGGFLPVAGYDPKHFLVTYLAAQYETEIWLAPLGGTRLLVPYRASISTPMGLGKVCVDHFRGKYALPGAGA